MKKIEFTMEVVDILYNTVRNCNLGCISPDGTDIPEDVLLGLADKGLEQIGATDDSRYYVKVVIDGSVYYRVEDGMWVTDVEVC